jgi:flagellar hook-associated protein 3 FlgL
VVAVSLYLADLERNQTQLQQAQGQVSSGLRVQHASDDPAAIAEILQTQAAISRNRQIQSNLGGVSTEVNTADSALQSAVQAVENAISLAAQGATSTTSANTRAALAQQVGGLQQTLVGISATAVNGHYIFSGDQDSQAPYQLDPTQPNGVKQVVTSSATRVIQSVDGTSFAVAKTAQDIFDARNADGTPAAGNVFAAVQALQTALTNNDTAGIAAASDSLKTADSYLNSQLAFYGEVENQVQSATDLAQKFQTQQQTELSQVSDADIPTIATEITQLQVQQQAAMSVEANVAQMKNLFSFLA